MSDNVIMNLILTGGKEMKKLVIIIFIMMVSGDSRLHNTAIIMNLMVREILLMEHIRKRQSCLAADI
jgi:hypothetical protein